MPHYRYLIIGAGMAADAAVKGIRELDGSGTIGIVGEELHAPYARPPLSKKLWQGKPFESIWRGTEGPGVTLWSGRRALVLDPDQRMVHDDQGETYTYERLLIATGGKPRRLPFGGDDVIYFRTVDDYLRLRALTDRGRKFVVVGGGFIGSEIAAALAMNGKKVTMLFPEEAVCQRVFPADLASFLNGYYREKGVELFAGETATDIRRQGEGLVVTTSTGRSLNADGVVAGLGIVPDVELAVQAGLPVENGITVDEQLRAGRPDIYAAGDAAAFHNPLLGSRIRVEHEDNALVMGRQAGRNMAGADEPYRHLPFFYSDLFELGYEAVGELDSRLETTVDWKTPFREGVVYYLREGLVRGVLLWNIFEKVDGARRLIAEQGPFRPEDLKGRLPD
jgi:3-phenylpropionate/trans-cinnamate dioxygenase ferredoxin reductase component